MLPDTLHRYSAQRAACKQWSVALGVVILLVGALGRLSAESLLWAAAPLLLLGLAEAGYAGQERRWAELLRNRKGSQDELAALLPEAAGAALGRTAGAALSLSIWPFYLGLFAIVGAGSSTLGPKHEHPAGAPVMAQMAAKPAGCGSGGCGSAAGCGSGGCGASTGKACSCSSGASKVVLQKPGQQKPGQPYLQTTTGPIPLPAGSQRPLNGAPLPGSQPLSAWPPRSVPPGVPSPLQPGNPAVRPVLPQSLPAANPAPANPAAPAPAAPAPTRPNP